MCLYTFSYPLPPRIAIARDPLRFVGGRVVERRRTDSGGDRYVVIVNIVIITTLITLITLSHY